MRRNLNISFGLLATLSTLLGSACGPQEGSPAGSETFDSQQEHESPVPTDLTGVTIVPERWVSAWDTTSNLDSPAFWGGQGRYWVVSTAKGTHDLWVHDATDGTLVQRVGHQGAGPGEFNYPNGIAIIGDLLLVVERDNHRIQMMSMPDFRSLGWFGTEELIRPYGIAFFQGDDGALEVYVTDDYGNEMDLPEGVDPTGDFTRRVNRFRLLPGSNGTPETIFLGSFGEADGPGALLVVESIQVDEEQGFLVVADEHRFELELYDLEGRYLNRTVGADIYRHGDPEGIMLYRCGGDGYWILTDQGETRSVFHILDRRTFEPLGTFAGEVTANTDGIWLEQGEVPGLGPGALFALHDDGGLAGFAWDDIASALGLRGGCNFRPSP
jgi:3-phytase